MSLSVNAQTLRDEVGAHIGAYLRARYPTNAAKLVARDTDSAVATTRRWLEGLYPDSRGFVALCVAYGPHFLSFVMAPVWERREPTDAADLLEEVACHIRAYSHLLHREIVNEAKDLSDLRFMRARDIRDVPAPAHQPRLAAS